MTGQKLSLIKRYSYNYIVPNPQPKHIKVLESTIQIRFIDGEYQYIPRKFTFNNKTRLNIKELTLITDELKRLNKK